MWEKNERFLNLKLHNFFLKKINFFPKKTNFSSFFPRHLFLARNSSSENSSFPRFLTRNHKYNWHILLYNPTQHCTIFKITKQNLWTLKQIHQAYIFKQIFPNSFLLLYPFNYYIAMHARSIQNLFMFLAPKYSCRYVVEIFISFKW